MLGVLEISLKQNINVKLEKQGKMIDPTINIGLSDSTENLVEIFCNFVKTSFINLFHS